MSGWTPGRWQRLGDLVNSDYGIICTSVSGRGADEILANAHLIAAAPELMDVAESLLEAFDAACERRDAKDKWLEALLSIIENARAAVAKARGESDE